MVKKITVFGSGAVGSTAAYHLLASLKFNELALVDINDGLAKGIALDLEDTAAFLGFSTRIVAGSDPALLAGSDIVIFTAGVARKDGMTRMDLLKINGKIAVDTAREVKRYAPQAIVIAVTNPLDVITYIFTKELQFARGRVMGMGSSLDTARMRGIFARRLNVAVGSIDGYVFGPHSEEMLVSPVRLGVSGEALARFTDAAGQDELCRRVQRRGAEIVGFLKNRSASFAPSLACARLVAAICGDSREVIPVAVMLDGEYGLRDICLGVPCVIDRNGASRVIETELSAAEKTVIDQMQKVFAEFKGALEGNSSGKL